MAPYAWTVIGAGPAGIAAVGRLLDHGIADDKIAWIDPAFAAGDLGQRWRSVSSNTIAGTFLEYLNGSSAFRFSEAPPLPLQEVDREETCALALVADPLLWVTEQLCERVHTFQTTATALNLGGPSVANSHRGPRAEFAECDPRSRRGSHEARLSAAGGNSG